jgi:hypothetical protein
MMTGQQYLYQVLESQSLTQEEIRKLEEDRLDVEKCLADAFGSGPSILLAGSHKKHTMVRESYDLDLVYRFPKDSDETLQDIYEGTAQALARSFFTERKTSAIRLKSLSNDDGSRRDFHIDVVPARTFDDDTGDAFIYQFSSPDQHRLKTNVQEHVNSVTKSGLKDVMKIAKLWKVRHGLPMKTFVLEMLSVQFLKKPSTDYESDIARFLAICRDEFPDARLIDPANSSNVISDLITPVDKELIANCALRGLELLDRASSDEERVQAWMTILRESSLPIKNTVTVAHTPEREPPKPWSSNQ